jgi:hypothetical protein
MRVFSDHLHADDELIPKRLSKKLVVSSHSFLLVAYFALFRQYNYLSGSLTMIYFSSLWHWHHPKKNSVARRVDIIFVFHGMLCGSYHATFLTNIFSIWIALVIVMVLGFVSNGIIFEHRCSSPVDNNKQSLTRYVVVQVLSINLDATLPMTLERENAYQQSVYAHMFFVHLLPSAVSIYCLMYGHPAIECL